MSTSEGDSMTPCETASSFVDWQPDCADTPGVPTAAPKSQPDAKPKLQGALPEGPLRRSLFRV